LLRLS